MNRFLLIGLLSAMSQVSLVWAGASSSVDNSGGDYVDASSGFTFSTTDDIGWCMWIKPAAIGSSMVYLDRTTATNAVINLQQSSSKFLSQIRDDGGAGLASPTSTTTPATTRWDFICGVRDTAGDLVYVSVNAVNEASLTDNTTTTISPTTRIFTNAENNKPANAKIAYVQMWDDLLLTAPAQAQAMWFPGTMPENLVMFWSMQDSGSTMSDLSGNARTGTVTGAVTEDTDGPPISLGLGASL